MKIETLLRKTKLFNGQTLDKRVNWKYVVVLVA